MKRIICIFLAFAVLCPYAFAATDLAINAKSAYLTEFSTGQVLYEQNADEKLPIASVTKIMTMLLIAEALDSGKISLEDKVSVSERAMSMGGSTMFLETGEQLTVDEMLKGIAVASANDGAVAMAEFLAGSESEFVKRMNERAAQLGMNNTSFVNTNGLDADGHYSSARDVAIMSRELLKHDVILKYTTIWTDTMRGGKFQLANTNKMVRFYDGATGLKTGSTSKALCCLSATALRDGMHLVAVVLGAPDSKTRFAGARALLDYGFAAYSLKEALPAESEIAKVRVSGGTVREVGANSRERRTVLLPKGDTSEITYSTELEDTIKSPVCKGDEIGTVAILKDGTQIDSAPLYAADDVDKKTFIFAFTQILKLIYH